jgi:hypothetical protein
MEGRVMKRFSIIGLAVVYIFLISIRPVESATYEETVAQWTSYQDVANWMKKYFCFDTKKKGTGIPQSPERTFEIKSGICFDGAAFIKDALNRINPSYNARYVFIKNKIGTNHWVTSFTLDGKLYIMDYMVGPKYIPMQGIHGPYNSLKDYEKFLSSLSIQEFIVEFVRHRRNKIPMKQESDSENQ